MWIYLWHIPAVYYFQNYTNWIYYLWKYLRVLAFAITLTLIQQAFFRQILRIKFLSDNSKKNIKAIFMW
jgi:peptidoglycan/LPS O-acetylase OafA/YrhL